MPTAPPSHEYLQRHSQRAEAARQRATDELVFYRAAEWLRLIERMLAREPICRACRKRGATDLDHIEDRADRPDLAMVESNLQPLCQRCHSTKTLLRWQARRKAGMGKVVGVYTMQGKGTGQSRMDVDIVARAIEKLTTSKATPVNAADRGGGVGKLEGTVNAAAKTA